MVDEEESWGILAAVGGLMIAINVSFWSVLADRHGRTLMVARVVLGGAQPRKQRP